MNDPSKVEICKENLAFDLYYRIDSRIFVVITNVNKTLRVQKN